MGRRSASRNAERSCMHSNAEHWNEVVWFCLVLNVCTTFSCHISLFQSYFNFPVGELIFGLSYFYHQLTKNTSSINAKYIPFEINLDNAAFCNKFVLIKVFLKTSDRELSSYYGSYKPPSLVYINHFILPLNTYRRR